MCICVAPSEMKNTKLYVGEGHYKGKDVHVLAYQNDAENLSDGPNAMVLPFPTSEEMTPDNVINTRSFKGFLKDIGDASKQVTRSLGKSVGVAAGAASFGAQVFHVGSYTVVLAKHVKYIPEALKQVPEKRRPEINARFLMHYGSMYKDQPIAICCWSGYIEAEPLLWWYVPKDKSTLFIPTMDSHDGNPPDLMARVEADHIISVGSADDSRVGHRNTVRYKDTIPTEVRGLLPNYVYGTSVRGKVKNGDMFVEANSLLTISDKFADLPKIKRGANLQNIDGEKEMSGWM